jgi:hypothetical protein
LTIFTFTKDNKLQLTFNINSDNIMNIKLILIILICTFLFQISVTKNLNNIIETTDNFFNNLIKEFGKFLQIYFLVKILIKFYILESIKLSYKIKVLIDKEIDQYLKVNLQQLCILKFTKEFSKFYLQEAGTMS